MNGGSLGRCGLAIYEALIARRQAAAFYADGVQLRDRFGDGEQVVDRTERAAAKIHVSASYYDTHTAVGEGVDDFDDAAIEELHLVDSNNLGISKDSFSELDRRRDRLSLDLAAIVGSHAVDPAVPLIEVRLEHLTVLFGERGTADTAHELLGLAAEHDAANYLNPAAASCVIHAPEFAFECQAGQLWDKWDEWENEMGEEPRAVLLDVDGTLIDSNDAHANAWVDVCQEFGYEVPFEKVRWLVGMGGDKVLPELTGLADDSRKGEKILERRGEIFREKYLPHLHTFDGTHDLLERLRDDGFVLVVATSASDEDLKALLKQGGLEDVIEAASTSDDAEESKPAPDIVEAALKKAGVAADRSLMLGDTPYDIEAAVRAGVPIVAVRCGGWQDDDLRGAIAIFDHPADIMARYSESPFGKK